MLERDQSPGASMAHTSPDEGACWLYTSGTTGRPKAAIHTHRNLAFTATHYPRAVLGLTADDVLLSAARMPFKSLATRDLPEAIPPRTPKTRAAGRAEGLSGVSPIGGRARYSGPRGR